MTPCLGAGLPVSSKDPFEKERARVEWFSECSCLIFAAVYGSEDAGLGGLLLVRSMCLVCCVVTANNIWQKWYDTVEFIHESVRHGSV